MPGRKKVFLIANTSWYLYNFRKGVINTILEMGYQVFCVAPEDDYTENLKQLGVQYISVKIDAKGINVLNDLQYFRSLLKIYKKHRPHFIFHYTIKPNIYGSFASKLLSIPNISIVSGAGIVFLKRNFLFWFVKILYKQSAVCSQEVWFVNEEDKAFFLEEKIVNDRKIRVLQGEGINTSFFKRKQPYQQISKPFSFLFSARLLWVKGIEYYIESARRLKDEQVNANFYVIGFFDDESKVAVKREDVRKWEKEGIIKFLGTFQDVRPILEETNCLVFPSFYREGVPRVLLEAASMNIPIITTDNVGCRDVVKDGVNGYLCRCKNFEDVYRAMRKMLSIGMPELTKMGNEGRKLVAEKFDEAHVLKIYIEVLKHYKV